MKKLGFLSLLLLLVFSACRKDVDVITETETIPDPIILEYEPEVNLITGTLIGRVEDESYQPVSEASVSLGGMTTTTDAYGHFFFDNVSMNSLGAFVKIEKDGYFLGSRRFFPNANAKTKVNIQLIQKEFNQNFASADGATVNVGDGGTLEFAPNSIRYEDGTAYSGNVNIATHWLNPRDFNTFEQMPGNLQGVNNLNEEVSLATYGMLVAELESDMGEPLNVIADNPATMRLNVPDELQANAPTEIPLWAFHETLGMWIQEGSATLVNGVYVGELPHFSFWNCDYPYPLVTIDFTIVDVLENPIAFQTIILTLTTDEFTSTGYGLTNQDGFVSGKVPAGEELSMQLLDLCGNVIYSQTLGAFEEDTSLGLIVVSEQNVQSTGVSGNLVDCDGNAVVNGVVRAVYDGRTVYQYTDGAPFDFSFVTCPTITDIQVIGSDLTNLLESFPVAATPNTQNDLGTITVCDVQLENYIIVTVDDVTKIYTGATIDTSADFTFINASDAEDSFIFTGFGGNTVGDYTNNTFENGIYDTEQEWNIGVTDLDSYIVTQFDSENVIGSYSGTFDNNFNQNNPVQVSVTVEFNISL